MKKFLIFVLLVAQAAQAEDWKLGGHVKVQGGYGFLPSDSMSVIQEDGSELSEQADIRGLASYNRGKFEFVSHGELLALNPERNFAGLVGPTSGLPDDRSQLFDLTGEVLDHNNAKGVARFDRLYAAYKSEDVVFKAGREAVAWGNGLLFQSLDLFQPFTPTEIDRDYKLGSDLLYSQVLFHSGDDIQITAVPRRDPDTRDLEGSESTYAAKYRTHFAESMLDLDLLAASHLGAPMIGGGIAFNWLDAVWRTDLSVTDDEGWTPQLVTNVDRSFTAFNLNWYGFVEYFHSEFGVSDCNYLPLPNPLVKRVRRGDLFTLAENYIAIGLRIETSALTNLYPTHILNVDDGSGIFQLRFIYDWFQDSTITIGSDLPYGGSNSEFGGLTLPGGLTTEPPSDLYIRVAYYF